MGADGYQSIGPKVDDIRILLRRLENTYDKQMYERLPFLSCFELDEWICFGVSMQVAEIAEIDLDILLSALNHLGYFFSTGDEDVQVDRSNGIVHVLGIPIAVLAGKVCWNRGDHAVAAVFWKFARELSLLLYASPEGS